MSNLHFTFSTQTVHTTQKDATPNIRLSALDLHALIVGDFTNEIAAHARARIAFAIRQNAHIKTICQGFEEGKNYQKDVKPQITPLKTNLPYLLPSGFCAIHHDDKNLVYNGVVQLDIDIKRKGGAKEAQRIMLAIKSLSAAFPYILLAAISPTGYGIKIFVTTSNTSIANHREAYEQVCNALCNALQIQRTDVDTLGVSQPCFLMSDPTAYFNPTATEFIVKNTCSVTPIATQKLFIGTENTTQAAQVIQSLITNQIDLDFEYSEFISFSICLINVFGEEKGKAYANAIFSISPKYNNDSRKYINKLKVCEHRDVKNGIGTIMYYASKHGIKPEYNNLQKVRDTTLKGEKGQYLTQILAQRGIDLTIENICGRKWIVPTGCGKSYLIAEFAKKHKVVVVCPSTALVNQYEKDGAKGFYEKHHDVSNADNFIAITYASLPYLSQYINPSEYHLLFDECHIFSSNGYTIKMLRQDVKQIEKYVSFTQFTATDLPTFDKRLIQPSTIVSIPKPTKKLYVCHFKEDVLFNVAKLVKESIAQGRFPFVLLNDTKDKQKELWSAIGLDTDGVALLDSHKKKSQVFKGIIEQERIIEGVRAIIATTVLKEGTNILNELELDFFVVGAFHHTEIEQAMNRFRNAKNVGCYICKGEAKAEQPKSFDPHKMAHIVKERAKNRVNERNNEKYEGIELDILRSENEISKKINRTPMTMDRYGIYEVCDIELGCIVFEGERSYEYLCDSYQIEKMAKFGFVYQQLGSIPCESGEETKEERLEFIQLCKEIEKEKYEVAIHQLSNVPNLDEELKNKSKDRTLTKEAKNAVARVQYLANTFDVDANTAVEVLAKRQDVKVDKVMKSELIIESNHEFKKMCTRAHVQRLEGDTAWMESNRKKTILFKAIRHGFKDHATNIYSSEQICNILLQALKVDNSIDVAAFGNTEAKVKSKLFELVNYFYEVNHTTTKVNEKTIRTIRLTTVNTIFDSFSYKEEKTTENGVYSSPKYRPILDSFSYKEEKTYKKEATFLDNKPTNKFKGKQLTFIDSFVQDET